MSQTAATPGPAPAEQTRAWEQIACPNRRLPRRDHSRHCPTGTAVFGQEVVVMREDVGAAAVVLGGSIAGLLAARVLAERFVTVVVVERDRLPCAAEPRRGVPQGRHIHGLLAGGQQAFEQLLPGLTQDLAAAGVPVGDTLADLRLRLNGHPLPAGAQRVDLGQCKPRDA